MNRKALFDVADHWFKDQGWKPFPFQTQTWTAFLQGKNGLLNAPTGSGKTYALWIPIILDYLKNNPNYKTKHQSGIKAIWITPLRALSVEIKQAMWQTKQAAILAPIVIQHRQTFRRQKSGVQYGKMCKKSRHL